MKEDLIKEIRRALGELLEEAGATGEAPEVSLEVPRQPEHGDFACSLAMGLAKALKTSPRAIAEDLTARIGNAGGLLAESEVAGPGFINFRVAPSAWQGLVATVVAAGEDFGSSAMGAGKALQVEFVSANPTGPLSTGHGRQAILGDCLARLMSKVGYQVTREYYFNDGGRQMRVLGDSVKARYLEELGLAAAPPVTALADPENAWQEQVDGLPVAFPSEGYQGEYIREIARDLVKNHEAALVDEPGDELFREFAHKEIFKDIEATLDGIGVHFDVHFNEKSLYEDGKIEEVLADLRKEGLISESDGAVWLTATEMGLDRDRVVVKSSGEPTYLLPDIAYHREKMRRGFDRVIDVQGADHIEQFPFGKRAVGALGFDEDRIELVMHQFVTITSGGEKVKQSTRRATFITVDELVEDVGRDVFRFFMIERKPEGHLDFDLDLAKDQNWRKNPAYYVQYAHARTHGIERRAREEGVSIPTADSFDPTRLDLPEEIELIRKLGEFPEMIERAAADREPHHVCYYLRELAGLWNPYIQDGTRHRVVSEDSELTGARLGLVLAVRAVLASGLDLLGLSAPERM